ncbi:glycosyltransferase family 4 protein [Thermomonas sp. HDW16]|uniref:glycosyltransferase family 4 protein n=1 Tax=Thermomonas sp. HDW16 TaxID=2714945 RepID=UPI0014088A06|nr:glycosyltransferase family 4 protein [Thermomonas sp. HDW16]QIL20513.1 glycosyltransferase family 4 protein [Thermomonas sp. HDW16]
MAVKSMSAGHGRCRELPRIGLIVPSLDEGGGVPAVARFLANVACNSGEFSLNLISLSTSSRDPASVRIVSPKSWINGVATRHGTWNQHSYIHVGAHLGELEFMRYLPRKALAEAIEGCDLLQVVAGFPAWANAVTGYGKPVSLQCATRAIVERRMRDRGGWNPPRLLRMGMTQLTDALDRKALRSVDAVQVENPWMLDYVSAVSRGRDVDIRYAPPGIDVATFKPITPRVPSGFSYILCVGRLADPRKNIELLLTAYARLAPALRTRVRLLLAGSTRPSLSFWEKADAFGVREQVTFVDCPSQEELVALYQAATVFALPSDEEGLGIVLLEAMGCGVPVVSTRSGGPEGIISEGVDGYLVPLGMQMHWPLG